MRNRITLLNRIKNSAYARDTSILTLGVIIAQVIPLIAYPILSRLYSPEDFGILSTLTSITALLSIFGSLRYENAILITKTSRLAAELIIAIQVIAIILLSLIGLLFIIFSNRISLLLNAPQIRNWLWICPICAYCIIIFECYNEWCVKHALFKNLSINKIINGGALPIGKIIFVFCKSSGILIGELFGHIVTAIASSIRFLKSDWKYFKNPSKLHIKYLYKRYADCPKFVLPARLLNKFGQEIPIFLIVSYFSAEELGYFSMASMLLVLPTRVIGKAITDTFRQKANLLIEKEGNCKKFYIKIFLTLLIFSVVCFSLLYMVSPWLFSFVLGDKWITSGYYCRIICFGSALSLITDFGAALYYVREKMRILFFWQICYFLLTSSSMVIGILVFKSIIPTLWCLVIGRSIAYILNGLITYSLAK